MEAKTHKIQYKIPAITAHPFNKSSIFDQQSKAVAASWLEILKDNKLLGFSLYSESADKTMTQLAVFSPCIYPNADYQLTALAADGTPISHASFSAKEVYEGSGELLDRLPYSTKTCTIYVDAIYKGVKLVQAKEGTQKQDRMNELSQRLVDGVQEVFQSDKYRDYLNTMSKFHDYSPRNSMLIFLQNPTATHVKPFKGWQRDFKRNVKKGEKAIYIIAPNVYKSKEEEQKKDSTGAPMSSPDGKPITEINEVKRVTYRTIPVFDVQQTEGEPLTLSLCDRLAGDVDNFNILSAALKNAASVPIEEKVFERNNEDDIELDGYFSPKEQKIYIDSQMSQQSKICAYIHEMAHAEIHNIENPDQYIKASHNLEEIQAESISFIVADHFGVDTGDNAFSYIASYSQDKTPKELFSCLEDIQGVANDLIGRIESKVLDIAPHLKPIDLLQEKPSREGIKDKIQTAKSQVAKSISRTAENRDLER